MSIRKTLYDAAIRSGKLLIKSAALLSIAGAAWGSIYTPPVLFPTVPYVSVQQLSPTGDEYSEISTTGFAGGLGCSPPAQACGGPTGDFETYAIATFNHLGVEASIGSAPGIGDAIATAWSVDLAQYDYTGAGTHEYLLVSAKFDGSVYRDSSGDVYVALEPPATEPYVCEVYAGPNQPGPSRGTCTAGLLLHPGVNQFQIQLRLQAGAYDDSSGGGGTADFSHTAYIDSVSLYDANTGVETPITIQGESGTVYGAAANSAPEPASFFLIGCGMLGIAATLRRRSRKS